MHVGTLGRAWGDHWGEHGGEQLLGRARGEHCCSSVTMDGLQVDAKRTRVAMRGRPITCYQLNSMHVGTLG